MEEKFPWKIFQVYIFFPYTKRPFLKVKYGNLCESRDPNSCEIQQRRWDSDFYEICINPTATEASFILDPIL